MMKSIMDTRRLVTFVLLGLMLVGSLVVAGCGNSNQDAGNNTGNGDAAGEGLSGTLTIAGSTSVQPFSEVLADKFMEAHPGVQVNIQGGGSSQGVTAAISGAADIGSASRNLKDEEKAENLVETVLAYDGIALVVHPSNQVGALTKDEVKNIYLGNITNWKEVGGADAKISVVCREAGSGTRGAFEEIVMGDDDISNHVIIQNSNGAVRTTVESDSNSIGFISLSIVNDQVKAVNIDEVTPSVENVKNGSYKISRPFLYITKTNPEGLSKAFIEFALSDEGQAIVVEEGAISSK